MQGKCVDAVAGIAVFLTLCVHPEKMDLITGEDSNSHHVHSWTYLCQATAFLPAENVVLSFSPLLVNCMKFAQTTGGVVNFDRSDCQLGAGRKA